MSLKDCKRKVGGTSIIVNAVCDTVVFSTLDVQAMQEHTRTSCCLRGEMSVGRRNLFRASPLHCGFFVWRFLSVAPPTTIITIATTTKADVRLYPFCRVVPLGNTQLAQPNPQKYPPPATNNTPNTKLN